MSGFRDEYGVAIFQMPIESQLSICQLKTRVCYGWCAFKKLSFLNF